MSRLPWLPVRRKTACFIWRQQCQLRRKSSSVILVYYINRHCNNMWKNLIVNNEQRKQKDSCFVGVISVKTISWVNDYCGTTILMDWLEQSLEQILLLGQAAGCSRVLKWARFVFRFGVAILPHAQYGPYYSGRRRRVIKWAPFVLLFFFSSF